MEASQKIVLFFSESSNVKKHKNKQEFAKLFFLRITELKTKPKYKGWVPYSRKKYRHKQ